MPREGCGSDEHDESAEWPLQTAPETEAQFFGALAYETLHAALGNFCIRPWNELPEVEAKAWMTVGMAVKDFVLCEGGGNADMGLDQRNILDGLRKSVYPFPWDRVF